MPYRGTPQVLADLVAGQIDLVFDQASSALPLVRGGKTKTYGVTSLQRLASASDIPTLHEGGLPDFQASYWFGLWAPKGTPANIVARLNADSAFNTILRSPSRWSAEGSFATTSM